MNSVGDSFVTADIAQRCWGKEDEIPLCAYSSLPKFEGDNGRACRRMNKLYRAEKRAFYKYCSKFVLPEAEKNRREAIAAGNPPVSAEVKLTYSITRNSDHIVSLYTEVRENMRDGSPPIIVRRGDTWDSSSGHLLSSADIFGSRHEAKKVMSATAKQQAEEQLSDRTAVYFEKLPSLLRRRLNTENFYLSDKGVFFFFRMYAVAPPCEGIPTFFIPYNNSMSKRFCPEKKHEGA